MPCVVIFTALGWCTLAWEGDVATRFRLPKADGSAEPEEEPASAIPAWVANLQEAVQRHLKGETQDFGRVPYAFDRVSPFQRSVYEAALMVKAGETWTYGQLASTVGLPPGASRAVGAALGRNPWPLLIPCHRFVGANGKMTGFSAAGGTTTKLRLLALEGAQWFPT